MWKPKLSLSSCLLPVTTRAIFHVALHGMPCRTSSLGPGLGALAGCQAWASEVGEPSSAHWTTRVLPAQRNINWREYSQRSLSQSENPAPFNDQQVPGLNISCQTTIKIGIQPHRLAESLPKIIKSSQTTQNTLPDVVLPAGKTRTSLIHQNTGTSPLHKEAYIIHWTNLTHWGQKPKSTGTTNLQPATRNSQTQ